MEWRPFWWKLLLTFTAEAVYVEDAIHGLKYYDEADDEQDMWETLETTFDGKLILWLQEPPASPFEGEKVEEEEGLA